MITDPCPNREGSSCRIASRLANVEFVTTCTDEACRFCSSKALPNRLENKVTYDLAAAELLRLGFNDRSVDLVNSADSLYKKNLIDRLSTLLSGVGVGSQLWKLLESIGIKHSADCSCLIWAELMNKWGPARCRDARPEIVEHIRTSAKSYGWLPYLKAAAKIVTLRLMFRINPLDIYGSLVDESIRLAEIAEEQQQCLPKSGPTG